MDQEDDYLERLGQAMIQDMSLVTEHHNWCGCKRTTEYHRDGSVTYNEEKCPKCQLKRFTPNRNLTSEEIEWMMIKDAMAKEYCNKKT
jgi:hypothetical protein